MAHPHLVKHKLLKLKKMGIDWNVSVKRERVRKTTPNPAMTSYESHAVATNGARALKVNKKTEVNKVTLLPPNDMLFDTSSGDVRDNNQVTKSQRRKGVHKSEPVKDTYPATPPKRRKLLEQDPADEKSDSSELIISSAAIGSSSVVQAYACLEDVPPFCVQNNELSSHISHLIRSMDSAINIAKANLNDLRGVADLSQKGTNEEQEMVRLENIDRMDRVHRKLRQLTSIYDISVGRILNYVTRDRNPAELESDTQSKEEGNHTPVTPPTSRGRVPCEQDNPSIYEYSRRSTAVSQKTSQ
ncbi:hypothetical protein GCK72_023205 [Caenorhabditis remanei]|uniref:Uncharacterized protein n=1 Tax=Caenorhabditis remanei TaxID=31234 RepID=A0A6A5FVV3_CAERE|nr:hypothetical protein GCK72_023205 [Caenorhabditis remanei]KAF1746748.1 hypothetical protein GCK72_023205 [Caenorhabditis remanei]